MPAEYLGWNGVRQVFEVERIREKGGKAATQVVYGITSLTTDIATAEKLLFFIRRHWAIENELHCVRDVAFAEDRCRVRNHRKAQILAAIRSTAVALLRHAGFANITKRAGMEKIWTMSNPGVFSGASAIGIIPREALVKKMRAVSAKKAGRRPRR